MEIAAILHDISCPYCRQKYGHCNGKHQEMESEPILRSFLQSFDLSEEWKERIIFLVCHHHTYDGVDGLDWQILLEADYLVNADEGNALKEDIRKFGDNVFRTAAGKRMLDALYLK